MLSLLYFSHMKNLLTFVIMLLVATACNNMTKPVPKQFKLEGKTMGTTYHVTYTDSAGNNYQAAIDSVLVEVNQAMSTYIPTSEISRFNQLNDTTTYVNPSRGFESVLVLADDVYKKSRGAFDPTVMPLVNAYGFGYEKMAQVDSVLVDSLMQFVGLNDHISYLWAIDPVSLSKGLRIRKLDHRTQLDLSAIAKGYGVDVVAILLDSMGVESYMVEIGGEVRTKGLNIKGKPWSIGIDSPSESNQFDHKLKAIVQLSNKSMATSGNYRNYKEQNGVKFVHTIDPKTGWPKVSNTLSVSVIANDCATADGFATAIMVMGVNKGLKLAGSLPDIEAYIIYVDNNGNMQTIATRGFAEIVEELE